MLPKLFAGTPPALPQRSGLCCLQNLPCLSSCLHFFRMHQSACPPSLPVYSGTSFRIADTGNCFPEYFRQSVLSVPTFSEHLQQSFSEYLTESRINYAKRLLVYSKQPLEEISLQCGYNTASYFSTVFKKNTGYSPNQFRKEFTTSGKSIDTI